MILALMTSSSRLGPNSLFGVTFCHVAPLARLRGGMDAESEEMTVQVGKLRQMPSGEWCVRCRNGPVDAGGMAAVDALQAKRGALLLVPHLRRGAPGLETDNNGYS